MGNEVVKLISEHNIIFSENENSDSADVKFIICDFDPNANDVSVNREKIDNWLSTLNHKPVVGKVVTRLDGKRDFSGHNAKIVEEEDEKGNKVRSMEFDTSAFGSFYETSIEKIDDVEYIVATAKVWKRFKEAYNIVKKRAESKKGLKTSWEINVSDAHEEDIDGKSVKVIDEGMFIGHALLGEFVKPAYKNSGILEVASESDHELIDALSQDMLTMSETEKEGSKETMTKANSKTQASEVTDHDVYSRVRKAINASDESKHFYVAMLYPYEYKAIGYTWDRAGDEDFVQFNYSVNSDETISISSQKEVKMRFVDAEVIDTQVSELEGKLSDAEKEVAEAGKSIASLTKDKEVLETKVSELEPFKTKVDELEATEQERVLAEKKEELKSFALEDDLIAEKDLEEDEQLKTLFSELTMDNYESSQEKIEVIKGRKAIAKFKETASKDKDGGTETSTANTSTKAKTNLNSGDEDGVLSALDIVKSMVKSK